MHSRIEPLKRENTLSRGDAFHLKQLKNVRKAVPAMKSLVYSRWGEGGGGGRHPRNECIHVLVYNTIKPLSIEIFFCEMNECIHFYVAVGWRESCPWVWVCIIFSHVYSR